jgi:hypothetical protein
MLRELTAEQFGEWAAFYGLEPWGFEEENRRVGVISATVANMAGKELKRPVSPADFIPRRAPEPTDVVAKVKAIFGWKGAPDGRPS